MRERLARLREPIDAASLAAFRFLFGVMGFVLAVRFEAKGWVQSLLIAPTHHLHYAGFEWVGEPAPLVLHGMFAVLALASLAIAVGVFYRIATVVFLVVFVWIELIDRALYLNHYYAITLMAFLLCVLPLGDGYSLDAVRRGGRWSDRFEVPKYALWAVRAQLGIIYFFAGVAKVQSDWLLRAEPMRTWLLARADFPVFGAWFTWPSTAYVMSWAGMMFDLSITFLLLARTTRVAAYMAVVGFHAATGAMFPIGMFPWLMIAWTLVFFEADWPRRLFRFSRAGTTVGRMTSFSDSARTRVLAAFFALQIALCLRSFAYPGNVLWTYEGYDFAWHVMIAEKGAHAELVVVDRDTGARSVVPASAYYTQQQARLMSEEPALIVQFAHVVADDFRGHGVRNVAVYARSYAALNGRHPQVFVDPRANLGRLTAWTPTSRYTSPLDTRLK